MTVRNRKTKPGQQPGFTLVEILTVIVIIGILAGLTVGAGIAVRNSVRRSIVVTDMKQLEMALQNYKSEAGELPPNFIDRDAVMRHIRKAFPRYRPVGDTSATGATLWQKFVFDVTDANSTFNVSGIQNYSGVLTAADLNALDASNSLVFWLGGLPDPDTGKPSGFHEDPSFPFKRGEPRSKPYFDFAEKRLDGFQYMQPGIRPPSPFVYFRAIKDAATGKFEYGYNNSGTFTPFSYGTGSDICVPYLEDAVNATPTDPADARVWRSPDTYQIIAAGLDGAFSTSTPIGATPPNPASFRFSKVGESFSDGDYDNLASFAEGELEDEL